ncbi:MAG: hypothetical protein HAW60_05540 [Bdellovibrionales bacterium]|nr:hypothetical protein [Bdellovibrionales bacterium]
MKKILFILLCFSITSISYTKTSFAKRGKSAKYSSAKKKRYRLLRKRKRASKYRAYKSFYRRHIRKLKQKSNWSVGVFTGATIGSEKDTFNLQPVGLSLAYHANSYVSIESRIFTFSTTQLDAEKVLSVYEIKPNLSFAGLVKVRKSIDKRRQFMLFALGGYSSISLTETEICRTTSTACDPDNLIDDSVSAYVGLWTLGAGLDYFPTEYMSLGFEVIRYMGVEDAFVESFSKFNELKINDFNVMQVSARYYF